MLVRGSVCPVCAAAADGADDLCLDCGWLLRGGPWPGHAGDDAVREHLRRLTDAVRRHDLAALARIVEAGGDPDDAPVRGGPLRPAERRALPRPGAEDPVDAALDAALARVADTGPVLVIDVGPDGIAGTFLEDADDPTAGGVRTRGWGPSPWVLAGGAPATGARERPDLTAPALALVGDPPTGAAVLLIDRTAGWPAPAAAADAVATRLRAAPAPLREITAPSARPLLHAGDLAAAAARRPLPQDLGLCAVRVHPVTFEATPAVVPLFRAGTRPGPDIRRTVTCTVASGTDPLALTVVRAADPSDVVHHRVADVPDGPTTFEVTLPGPQGVEFSVATRDGLRRGPSVPTRRLVPPAVDLTVAIELGGTDEAVAARVGAARRVVEELAGWRSDPAHVRVAVVAYDDHRFTGSGPDEVLRTSPYGGTAAASRFLDGLAASPVRWQTEAPVEDAVRHAAGLDRSVHAVRALLLLGARRPHPAGPASSDACPNAVDLTAALRRLQRDGVRRVAVWDPPPSHLSGTRGAAETTTSWSRLTDGRVHPAGTTPGTVLTALGVPRRVPAPTPVALPILTRS